MASYNGINDWLANMVENADLESDQLTVDGSENRAYISIGYIFLQSYLHHQLKTGQAYRPASGPAWEPEAA